MKIKVIDTTIKTKDNLIPYISSIFPLINTERIKKLINDFVDTITFVTEYPYTDKHYRDSYNLLYSSKFDDYPRDCIRIHVFNISFTKFSDIKKLQGNYCGYFIIRPLERYPLGRSMLNPQILKKHNFLTCLSKEKIHILGAKMEISGFPHIAQDEQTHSCAESSLWALLTYFGQKYIDYKPVLPSEIIRKVGLLSNHKMLPSRGLTVEELAGCLNNSGQNCLLYFLLQEDKTSGLSILNIYIESGMPLIVTLTNDQNGHAVLAIGHDEINVSDVKSTFTSSEGCWHDVSFYEKQLVLIDDNMTPFDVVPSDNPAIHYAGSLKTMKLSAFIVPLHKEMFLDAQLAFGLVTTIFNDKNYGLQKFGKKWITRLFLTTSNSYKTFLETRSTVAEQIKNLLLHTSMPKFIWICELYKLDDYEKGITSGILLLDSTGDNSFNSIIYYFIDDNRIVNKDAFTWQGTHGMIKYSDIPYRNNLKGAWNSWKH